MPYVVSVVGHRAARHAHVVALEELHQFGGSGARSMILVEQIHSGTAEAERVWLRKSSMDMFFMDLELVELYQTGPKDIF
jgi:hypothetical protein